VRTVFFTDLITIAAALASKPAHIATQCSPPFYPYYTINTIIINITTAAGVKSVTDRPFPHHGAEKYLTSTKGIGRYFSRGSQNKIWMITNLR